jgi:hypothetical protein
MMMGSHTPASDVLSEEECFSVFVHLQREGLGACETAFQMGQGREKKLVTEEPKPVGSGESIYRIRKEIA